MNIKRAKKCELCGHYIRTKSENIKVVMSIFKSYAFVSRTSSGKLISLNVLKAEISRPQFLYGPPTVSVWLHLK